MRLVLAVVVSLAALSPAGVSAQSTHSWLVRLGEDTLSLETVTRTSTELRGEYVVRTPRSLHRTYVLQLAPDGTVRGFEMATRPLGAPAGTGESRARIEFLGDSALVTTPRGDSSVTARVAAGRGAVPYLNGVMGIMDQIVWQARTLGSDSLVLAMVPPGGPVLRASVTRRSDDTLRLDVTTPVGPVPPFWLVRDAEHRLRSWNGRGSVFQADAERVATPDFAALAATFASRPIGALSTRDTVRATLGPAELWLDYGRPLKRGRQVFGEVVPWRIVWRTGANAATQFRTSHDLRLGGARLAAGTYSLWTLPSPTGWQLIVNEQHGQWGTQYDARYDVLRVKLATEALVEPVEPVDQFTMTLEGGPRDGRLVLAWDRTRASVALRAER